MYDSGHKLYYLRNEKVFYLLLSGLTYSEIAEKYYYRQKYKFIYEVRKLLKLFNLKNRRQLAYYAVKNGLVNLNLVEEYNGDRFNL